MTKENAIPNWAKAFLHSFSQVVLVENIISAVLIIAAIFVYDINLGVLAVIGSVVGNITAKLIGCDDGAITSGLFGFNTVLVGVAAGVFFAGQDAYIVAILGSILTIPLTIVVNNLCGRLGLPGFTLPFILMTWFFILLSFSGNLVTTNMAANLAETTTVATGSLVFPDALLKGLGEIYLLDSIWSSLLIFAAFAIDRWHLAIKIAAVIVLSLVVGFVFEVNTVSLTMGMFTYNSILVLMGMETFSKSKGNGRKYAIVALGVVFAVLVDMAAPAVLKVFALPSLTFPFVLVTWGILYLEQHLSEEK